MRVVIAHTLPHLLTAMEAATALETSLTLQTPPDAIFYAGPAYLLRMFAQAAASCPSANVTFILDCADAGAEAITAMRLGARHIRSSAPEEIRQKLAGIAQQQGVRLHDRTYEALDLLSVRNTKDACMQWLREGLCK